MCCFTFYVRQLTLKCTESLPFVNVTFQTMASMSLFCGVMLHSVYHKSHNWPQEQINQNNFCVYRVTFLWGKLYRNKPLKKFDFLSSLWYFQSWGHDTPTALWPLKASVRLVGSAWCKGFQRESCPWTTVQPLFRVFRFMAVVSSNLWVLQMLARWVKAFCLLLCFFNAFHTEHPNLPSCTHLQWTTMGPASGGLQAFTLLRKARMGVGYSGTPWSGQAMNWNCLTSRFSLEPFCGKIRWVSRA